MVEPTNPQDNGGVSEERQIGEVVDQLDRRYAHQGGVHRDVIEAAVRSAWARYQDATVTTYRAILAERAALDALQAWFGAPTGLGIDTEISGGSGR